MMWIMLQLANLFKSNSFFFFSSPKSGKVAMTLSYVEMEA